MNVKKKIIRFKFCSYQYEPLIATIIELKNLKSKFKFILNIKY